MDSFNNRVGSWLSRILFLASIRIQSSFSQKFIFLLIDHAEMVAIRCCIRMNWNSKLKLSNYWTLLFHPLFSREELEEYRRPTDSENELVPLEVYSRKYSALIFFSQIWEIYISVSNTKDDSQSWTIMDISYISDVEKNSGGSV